MLFVNSRNKKLKAVALTVLNESLKADTFTEKERIRLNKSLKSFYNDMNDEQVEALVKWSRKNKKDTELYAYFKEKYGFGTKAFLNKDDRKFIANQIKEFGYDNEQLELVEELLTTEYVNVQDNIISDSLKIKGVSFTLSDPKIVKAIFDRKSFWEDHVGNVINARISESIGHLYLDGISGRNALVKNPGKYYTKTGKIIQKNMIELLEKSGRSAAKSLVFIETETAAIQNMANTDHIDHNGIIYDSAKWKHKYGARQSGLVKVSDNTLKPSTGSTDLIRKHHLDMHNKTRDINGKFNKFKNASGEVQPVTGPLDPSMGAEDVVKCHCRLQPVLKKLPTKNNIWLG